MSETTQLNRTISIKQADRLTPFFISLFVVLMLVPVQLIVERPMLILERFIPGGGWIEIPIIAVYAFILAEKMMDPARSARWRLISWTIFSVVFFGQLILGMAGFETFLMTGKLHLPIPMMIMGGPIYRGELSFMTILFLSTIVLTGPAWCSHLCYFGAIDNLFSRRKRPVKGKISNRGSWKGAVLIFVVLAILLLRWFNMSLQFATILGIGFGVLGLLIIFFLSTRKGKMIHCLTWCPIGTLVNYGRYINPFRMVVDRSSCTLCNACTRYCRYDALNRADIESGKPGITCTYCGDCVTSCHAGSIQYKVFRMSPERSRNVYLFLTISAHAVFLALARI